MLRELFPLNLATAGLAALCAMAFVIAIRPSGYVLVCCLALLYPIAYAAFPDWYLRASARFELLGVSNLAITLAWVAMSGVAWVAGAGVWALALAWALSPLAGSVVSLGVLRSAFSVSNPASFRQSAGMHLAPALRFGIAGLLSNVSLPVTLAAMAAGASAASAGAFGIGIRIAALLVGGLGTLSQHLMVDVHGSRSGPSQLRLVLAFALFTGIVIAASLVFAVSPLFSAVLGVSFEPERLWFVAGVVGLGVAGVKQGVVPHFAAQVFDRRRPWVAAAGVAVTVTTVGFGLASGTSWLLAVGLPFGEAVATALMLGSTLTTSAPPESPTA